MKQIRIELRASEGGNDSKLLVQDLMNVYVRSCKNRNFNWRIEENRDGFAVIWIEGENAHKYFSNESGSHCFVRIPPTERNGRVQTSFVTVAVMNASAQATFELDRSSINKQYTCSRGKGGQNVNRVHSCVVLTHVPTGIQVRCEDTRDQAKNEKLAYERIREKLEKLDASARLKRVKETRNSQIGESGRGVKRRTYRVIDGTVQDHVTGKKCRWKDFLRGKLELLVV